MLTRLTPLLLALAALAVSAAAQGPAEPTGSSKPAAEKKSDSPSRYEKAVAGVGDEDLDAQRAEMDARFSARAAAVKDAADRRQFYHVGAEKKRLEFERHASEERKAFYLYLKSVALDERAGRLKDFEDKQERDRARFDKDQLAEAKRWFSDEIEGNWRSESLLKQEPAPRAAVASAASAQPEAAAPRPRRPAIVRKPKPVHRRRSRVARKKRAEASDDSSSSDAADDASGPAN